MTDKQIQDCAVANLRSMADRIEAGTARVTRLCWEDGANSIVHGPDQIEREQTFTLRYWPGKP